MPEVMRCEVYKTLSRMDDVMSGFASPFLKIETNDMIIPARMSLKLPLRIATAMTISSTKTQKTNCMAHAIAKNAVQEVGS